MICRKCNKEYQESFFLPIPEKWQRYDTCVFCLTNYYRSIVDFLEGAGQSKFPDQYIEKEQGEKSQAGRSITCLEKKLASIKELKAVLWQWCIRPEQQQRKQNLLSFQFKCTIDDDCRCKAIAIEAEDRSFRFQLLQPHNCDPDKRNLDHAREEIAAFCDFVQKLELCLHDPALAQTKNWSTEYLDISNTYKRLQEELHALEDRAIEQGWGMPCNWRRARGQANIPPGKVDLERLRQIAHDNNCGKELIDYIAAAFHTEEHSTYFQQRGYFILLICAQEEMLCSLLEKRIQIMLYARNLLNNDLYLLCHKKLSCTIMRNHIWMVLLLLYGLRAKRNLGNYPLIGFTEPRDSESPDFYQKLQQLSPDFFQNTHCYIHGR